VTIERRAPGAKRFSQIAALTTDAHGYFQRRFARRPGGYRYSWQVQKLARGTSGLVVIDR
jgi:hypothetical protein